MLHDRNHLNLHIFDSDISASLNGKDDLVDLRLFSLNLHGHRTIPFVSYPSCAAIEVCCMAGPIPEADALYVAIKYDVLPHDAVICHG